MTIQMYVEPDGNDTSITVIYDLTEPISPELDAFDRLYGEMNPVEEWYLRRGIF